MVYYISRTVLKLATQTTIGKLGMAVKGLNVSAILQIIMVTTTSQ